MPRPDTHGMILSHRLRRGAYLDSIVLMQLQVALRAEPGIEDCSAVMATAANLSLLAASDMLPEGLEATGADDLLLVVRAVDSVAGESALDRVDELLGQRTSASHEDDLPAPFSVREACRRLPDARWAAISVPGRWASRVAHDALEAGLDIFLYSDNVSVADERLLKRRAAARGRLVLGPDCGTAILGGIGFGFANRVRAGCIGLVGASGTGLQAITSRIDDLGAGVSHAIGIGGRDLSREIGGASALAALRLLAADPATQVVVLVSKPPDAAVARALVTAARAVPKPVVICFLGTIPPVARVTNLNFAAGLEQAADLAVSLAADEEKAAVTVTSRTTMPCRLPAAPGGFLRALFAGGTLALETLAQLRFFLPLRANLSLEGVEAIDDPSTSTGHTVLDMGDDTLTVGRLHPMIDPDLRLRRLQIEAADVTVSTILLDVVLGTGSEADPAERLAPAIQEIRARRADLEILVVVVGTEDDPQGRRDQIDRLAAAGAHVFERLGPALEAIVRRTAASPAFDPQPDAAPVAAEPTPLGPPQVINVGLESFHQSFVAQGAPAVHVAWRPPAGGDARLLALLDVLASDQPAPDVSA